MGLPIVYRRLALAVALFGLMCVSIGAERLAAQGALDGSLVVPRLGVSLGPEQVTMGVEIVMDDVADITYLEFRPGIDLGLGDEQTTLRGSANIGYSVPTSGGDVRVTPLFGVSATYSSYEVTPGDGETMRDESDTDLGVNLGAAAQAGDLIFEAVIVLGSSPDISVSVGFGIG